MPTAKDVERAHTHSWSRKDKAVYCENCSTHFTEYIKELEQRIKQLELRQGTEVHAMALP
jgi:hypothetical protein